MPVEIPSPFTLLHLLCPGSLTFAYGLDQWLSHLMTSLWVQAVGVTGRRPEAGGKLQSGCLFSQLAPYLDCPGLDVDWPQVLSTWLSPGVLVTPFPPLVSGAGMVTASSLNVF